MYYLLWSGDFLAEFDNLLECSLKSIGILILTQVPRIDTRIFQLQEFSLTVS
ncbi:hypothetical protein D3C81_2159050 [compost metagenome]